jgi:hypothetical protein
MYRFIENLVLIVQLDGFIGKQPHRPVSAAFMGEKAAQGDQSGLKNAIDLSGKDATARLRIMAVSSPCSTNCFLTRSMVFMLTCKSREMVSMMERCCRYGFSSQAKRIRVVQDILDFLLALAADRFERFTLLLA